METRKQSFIKTYQKYPSQFWLLIVGLFIAMIGASMIWPFLMIYVSESLAMPLAEIAGLITFNGLVGLVASYFGGPLSDKLGRKWLMVVSLLGNGVTYLAFIYADSYAAFAVLMALRGLFNPLYRVGINAMISDLVPESDRTDAYALMRLASNSGIAIGPAIGGFVAVASYAIGFTAAAITISFFALLIAFFVKETLPQIEPDAEQSAEQTSGYKQVFQDKQFVSFISVYMLLHITAFIMWVLLGVYSKQNFQLPESQFGFIFATNAGIVVLFQMRVTRAAKGFAPLSMLTLGAFIYALGVGSVSLGNGFWGFLLSFVIVSIGELIAMPIATTYAANLAPAMMRGRYMGMFTLVQGLASSIAPVLGGLLNDHISPKAIWYGGGLIGLISALGFWLMYKRYPQTTPELQPLAAD